MEPPRSLTKAENEVSAPHVLLKTPAAVNTCEAPLSHCFTISTLYVAAERKKHFNHEQGAKTLA